MSVAHSDGILLQEYMVFVSRLAEYLEEIVVKIRVLVRFWPFTVLRGLWREMSVI